MIEVNKNKLGKKHLAIIITAGILALLIVAYVILNAVLPTLGNSGGGNGSDMPGYDESIGESDYMGSSTIYPYLAKSNIVSITVGSEIDTFTMQKAKDSEGNLLSYFLFYYMDDEGRARAYLPEITYAEDNFDYTDFYSIETADGLNATKIDYLCAAIGALYYDYRVPLSQDVSEKNSQLELYGLDKDNREKIVITYLDDEGKQQEYVIIVGDKLITGTGYYFMLEGRDYVYASAASERFSYALGGFEAFLHSRIVAKGADGDGIYEPYLTTDYKQWKNVYYDVQRDSMGNPILDDNGKTIPYAVTAGSNVIINADLITPIYKAADTPTSDSYLSDGYTRDGYSQMEVDLSYISGRDNFTRMVAALVGKSVDIDDEDASESRVTVINGINEAVLQNGEKGKYEYTIYAIESVLDDTNEYFDEGTPVAGFDLVKVIYDYSVDGEKQNKDRCHAIIDLSAAKAIPEDVKNALAAAAVGSLESPITFSVYYTESNALKRSVSYVVTKINTVFEMVDDDISYLDKITESSIVSLTYHTVMIDTDGTQQIGEDEELLIDLSAVSGDADDVNVMIKNAIIGLGAGEVNVEVEVGELYFQDMLNFVEYKVKNIVGFMERELIVSFRFANESDRDAFYAESSYINTIQENDPSSPYRLYGLNVDNCDKVVRILGGISTNGSSQQSEGLVGDKTVAVGLTPTVMSRYHLYDGYTIYFELPRNIGEDASNSDDFAWEGTLGFNLYISPVQVDPDTGDLFRYVGCDMYDIVVTISADTFSFVDYSFPEYWARRNLAMVSSSNIDKVELDLYMDDLKGSYNFDVDHKTIYIYNNQHYETKPNDGATEYDFITVKASIDGFTGNASEDGVYNETVLSSLLASLGKDSMTLADVYNRAAGLVPGKDTGLTLGNDTMGTSYFKENLVILYSTFYNGILTAEEQASAKANGIAMTISFKVGKSSEALTYVYDFYRLDDRRVMVSFYAKDSEGSTTAKVNDFYVSDFGFKKIIRNFTNLLNAEEVVPDVGYEK